MFLEYMDYLDIVTQQVPFFCSINVLEKIQTKYGTIKSWSNSLEIDGEISFTDLKWTVQQFINEGIEICNEEKGTEQEKIDLETAGRIIAAYSQNKTMEAITEQYLSCINGTEKNLKTRQSISKKTSQNKKWTLPGLFSSVKRSLNMRRMKSGI